MASKYFQTKSVEQIINESEEGEHKLSRHLNVWSLIAIGIGCIIGTGIFVLTGKVAVANAGPGVVLSFVVCGIACIVSALCYAEFASFIPIAGSAYTYSYASMGELIAWVIGWDLILEYGLSTSAVAAGWSSHFVNFLQLTGIGHWPDALALTPFDPLKGGGHGIANIPAILISLVITGLLIVGIKESARVNNIIVVIKLSVAVFFIGVGLMFINTENWHPFVPKFKSENEILLDKLQTNFNQINKANAGDPNTIHAVEVVSGLSALSPAIEGEKHAEDIAPIKKQINEGIAELDRVYQQMNLSGIRITPEEKDAINTSLHRLKDSSENTDSGIDWNKTEFWKVILNLFGKNITNGFGGLQGILMGASIIFFAYIGFDAVSTTSEEAINPSRDVPRGIIWSLIICTILYILMAAVFTGIVRCDGTLTMDDLGVDKGAPMVYAFKQVPNTLVNKWAAFLIDVGGLCGITSVLLVTLLGQSRVFYSMSRDKLLPEWIARIHPKFKTPYIGTAITGFMVALVAGFVPLDTIAEMANIGTLFAFVLVAAGIIFLRRYQPERIAAFRTPLVPLIPILAIVFCFALMMSLPAMTWVRFVVWMGLGMLIYFTYGYKNSRLRLQKTS